MFFVLNMRLNHKSAWLFAVSKHTFLAFLSQLNLLGYVHRMISFTQEKKYPESSQIRTVLVSDYLCRLRLFSSDAFFFTYVYVRMLNTHQWTSLRVLSTPYVYVGRKNAALEINPYTQKNESEKRTNPE